MLILLPLRNVHVCNDMECNACVGAHVCVYVCVRARTCVCTCVYMSVCVCACVSMHFAD